MNQQLTKQQPEQQQEQQRKNESQNYLILFLLFPFQNPRKLLMEERQRKDKRKKLVKSEKNALHLQQI